MTQKLTVWYENGEQAEYPVSDDVTVKGLRNALGQPGREVEETTSGPSGETAVGEEPTTYTSTTTRNTANNNWVIIESGKSKVFLKLAAVIVIELTPAPKRGKKA